MKVCFLAHNLKDDNGGGTLARHIVLGLHDSLSCEIMTFIYEPSGLPFEISLSRGKLGFLKNFFALRQAIKLCDVIHAFDVYPYAILAYLASLGLGKKSIITLVGTGSIHPLYQKPSSFFAKLALKRADALVAISRFTRNEVLKRVTGLSIQVINPALDESDFKFISKRELPERVRKYQPYILSVGAIRKRKGYHKSILAFEKIHKVFPELNYVIVGKRGSGNYYREVSGLITGSGLGDRVFPIEDVETREDLYNFYHGAELFCLMSQNTGHDVEGFGIVFLEAAAAGLPVVGTKNCGIDDAALDGGNGILVGEGDVDDFARAIMKILSDENLKKGMLEKSKEFVKSFSWENKVKEYVSIYARLTR